MPIELICPSCLKAGQVPDAYAGKTVTCPDCKAQMPVPPSGNTVLASGVTPDWMSDPFRGSATAAPSVPPVTPPPVPAAFPASAVAMAPLPAVSELPDPAEARAREAVHRSMPDEPWYYDSCRWTTSFLAALALLIETWTVLRTLTLVADGTRAGASDNAVIAGLVILGTEACTMMATVAGWALVLVIVDGASKLRRVAHYAGRV